MVLLRERKPHRKVEGKRRTNWGRVSGDDSTSSTSASRWRKEVKENEFVNNICLTLMQRSAWDSILEQNNLASELTPQLVVQVLLKTQTDAKASLNFFNWAEKQQGFKHNLESWCIIIHILASGGLLNPAQTLIRRIGSAKRASALFNTLLKTFKGCNSKPPVFDLLLKTYSRSRMIPEAKETFYRMKAYGFIPSTRACNEFLYALQKLNKTEMAWDFYSEMRRSGINPNEYTFSVIAQLLCKEGKLVEAAKLLDEMKEKGCKPNVVTYNIVIDGHCKVGKVAEGLNLIGKMSEKGLIPDFSIDSSILNGLCTLRKIEEADRLFEEMLHKTSAPVNDATIQYCPTKKIEKAVGFAPDLVPYNAFINELCKLGKMDAAEMVFQKVLDKGLMLNNAICNAMIVGYSKEGRIKEALKMHDVMLQKNLLPDASTYNAIVNGLCMEGRVEKASEIFNAMLESGLVGNLATYSGMITALCKEGNLEGANRYLHDMLERGMVPNVGTCSSLVNQFCEDGSTNEALYLHEKSKDCGLLLDVDTYNALLLGLSQKRQMQEAKNIFNYMLNKGLSPNTISYTTMIDGHCKEGNFREALKLHDEMLQKGLKPDDATYKDLIIGFDSLRLLTASSLKGLPCILASYIDPISCSYDAETDSWKDFIFYETPNTESSGKGCAGQSENRQQEPSLHCLFRAQSRVLVVSTSSFLPPPYKGLASMFPHSHIHAVSILEEVIERIDNVPRVLPPPRIGLASMSPPPCVHSIYNAHDRNKSTQTLAKCPSLIAYHLTLSSMHIGRGAPNDMHLKVMQQNFRAHYSKFTIN
eukprot:Gb_34884 [translate_table: standard]